MALTGNAILSKGLGLINMNQDSQDRKMFKTRVVYFKAHFGLHPYHVARVWKQLLETDIEEARVLPRVLDEIKYFFMALHFLKRYKTELELAAMFQINEKTAREWMWYYVRKIGALKAEKIVWPDDDEWGDLIFICSIDGTHCRMEEIPDPVWRENPANYTFKHNQAGVNYEVVLHLWEDRIISFRQTDAATPGDLENFRNVVRDKIPDGKRGIGDEGYRGESDVISTRNPLDAEHVKAFKARAKSRHETINEHLKTFKCMKEDFRHGKVKHGQCADAIAVLCQFGMEGPVEFRSILFQI